MTTAEIRLWGRQVGAVALRRGDQFASFEYYPDFVEHGLDIAPVMMPLETGRIHTFPGLALETFHGLPGMLADSLPDKFGNALIDAWLATQGREARSFSAIERLCYTGSRGMGALEFFPPEGPFLDTSEKIQIDALVRLASEVLRQRDELQGSLAPAHREQALMDILRVGTSAAGARAKAIVAWNPQTDELRSGQVRAGKGFEYWLLKFDGVAGNKDKEIADAQGFGALEYAYFLMATAAGIAMSPCRLLEENGRRHFMTKRFDRTADGNKLHMQSLCALAHLDFNVAGAHSYEQAFMTISRLGLPMDAVEEQFRRMVFNVVARNQDDHAKNIAFLMDSSGRWSLSPAFDVGFSYNPAGAWTSTHQMSINGKRDAFSVADFEICAKTAHLARGRAAAILDEVSRAVARWGEFAAAAEIPATWTRQVASTFRLDLSPIVAAATINMTPTRPTL